MMQPQLPYAEQAANIARVSGRIAPHIMDFLRTTGVGGTFHMKVLQAYVSLATSGFTAPASADRILRNLRARGYCDYKVLHRQQSLYEIISVG